MNSSNEGLVSSLRSFSLSAIRLNDLSDIRKAADLIEAQATEIADLKREVERAYREGFRHGAAHGHWNEGDAWDVSNARAALTKGQVDAG